MLVAEPLRCCHPSTQALLLPVAVLVMLLASLAGCLPSVKLDDAIENSCCLLFLWGLFWVFFFCCCCCCCF